MSCSPDTDIVENREGNETVQMQSSEVANEKLVNGVKTEYYQDGTKKEECEYLEGKKNGIFKNWYPNGQLEREGMMVNDRWSGEYWEWYDNGKVRVSGRYLEGKRDGEWLFFSEEGNSLPPVLFEKGEEVTRQLPSLFR